MSLNVVCFLRSRVIKSLLVCTQLQAPHWLHVSEPRILVHVFSVCVAWLWASFQPHYQKTAHWILCQHLSTSVHSFLPDVNSVLMLAVEERCQILFGLKWKIHRAVQVEISPQAVWGSQKHLIHEKLGEAHWSRVCSVINRLSGAFAAFQSHGKHQTADFKSFPAAGLSGWPMQLRPFPFKVERGSFSLRAGCTSPTHLEREPPVWWHFLQQRSHWSVDGSFTL